MNKTEEMDEFEKALNRALQRVDAPEGFAAKVAALADAKPKAKLFMMPSAPTWMSGAIAATLVMGCLVAEHVHVVRQQEQVAANERQFEEAMRVTNHALDQTQEQLAKAGLKLGE